MRYWHSMQGVPAPTAPMQIISVVPDGVDWDVTIAGAATHVTVDSQKKLHHGRSTFVRIDEWKKYGVKWLIRKSTQVELRAWTDGR